MNYTIPAHRRGDTWDGIYTITISVNGVPINLTGANVTMQLRESTDSPVVLTFSTTDSSIVIINAVNGIIRIPERKIEIPPGNYIFDLQVDYSDGKTKTYLEGKWEITPDVTDI